MPTVSSGVTASSVEPKAPSAPTPEAEGDQTEMAWNPNPYGAASAPPGFLPGQSAPAGFHTGGYGQGAPGGYGQTAPGYPPTAYGAPAGFGAAPNQPPPGVPQDLWQWFQAVDTDRSGKINAVELKAALLNGNYSSFNEGTCRLMIKLFDRDNSGTIDIHEFASLWKYITDWKACFDRFDQDRSGTINTGVRTYSGRKGGLATGDSISFDDFIEACVTIKNLTDTFRRYDQHGQGVITVGFEQFLDMVSQSIL